VILGFLADETGFSASEILGFDAGSATFWWNCVMAWRTHAKDKGD